MNSGAPEGLAVSASQPTLTKYKYKYIYSTSIKHETPTNKWVSRRTEHRFYAKFAADITTRN